MNPIEGGYISLFRKFQRNPIWLDKDPFDKRSAWLDILFEARWHGSPNVTIIEGHIITVQRGEVAYSYPTWAKRWRWTPSKVRRWFKQLEKLGQIALVNEYKTMRVIVCNYDTYNDPCHAVELQSGYEPTTTRKGGVNDPKTTEEREEGKTGEEGKDSTSPHLKMIAQLERFRSSHTACENITEPMFVAAIQAARTVDTAPDVDEALEKWVVDVAGASHLGFPIREFNKYLKKSVQLVQKKNTGGAARRNKRHPALG